MGSRITEVLLPATSRPCYILAMPDELSTAPAVPAVNDAALVVGLSGLGSAAALTLAASGVKRLILLDAKVVEAKDLDCGPLYSEADVGRPRSEAAAAQLARLFPALAVEPWSQVAAPEVLASLTDRSGVVVGTSGEVSDHLLAHDIAVTARRPFVHAGLMRYSALLLTVIPGVSACLRCLFESGPTAEVAPPAGAFGAMATFAGGLAGSEAWRLLSGAPPAAYADRALVYEARSARARIVNVHRRLDCATCGAAGAVA